MGRWNIIDKDGHNDTQDMVYNCYNAPANKVVNLGPT